MTTEPNMYHRAISGGDLCAIYVHAGAGYHSTSNEKNHLRACNDAARVAMAVLKNGGGAIEAVEMAVRLLEDRDITNAGFGSNLTMDGVVECDACIVDHYGRSGAVGAITQVRNPIAVARFVLDASIKPLSLSRVPPNFLVGEGAVDFAHSHMFNILPKDFLVSEGAKLRWQTWRRDLLRAEEDEQRSHNQVSSPPPDRKSLSRSASTTPAINTSFPSPSTTPQDESGPQSLNFIKHATGDGPALKCFGEASYNRGFDECSTDDGLAKVAQARKRQRTDGSSLDCHSVTSASVEQIDDAQLTRTSVRLPSSLQEERDDQITDTVGAIAVDCYGRIAAASSSGGIGMKHKGRCGPAALVGISTAVIPADPDDPDEQCVATVTSGTGEHMATTAAAQTAADRILSCTRKSKGRLEPCTEDEALFSMIKNDFMNHPGVQNSPCQGALGVLCVKKTKQGIYFYFGHNTDSFALASMHSDEKKPVCVMSRSRESGLIAQGARKCRSRRAGKSH